MVKLLDRRKGHGFDVYIFTRDEHPPAHVHVFRGDQDAVVTLTTMEIRPNSSFNSRDIGKILDLIAENREMLLEAWDTYTELPRE